MLNGLVDTLAAFAVYSGTTKPLKSIALLNSNRRFPENDVVFRGQCLE